jgi:hypothetical protein
MESTSANMPSWAQNQGMDVDADKLAATLARRMAAIVPDGFHVETADGMLWYSADEGRFPGQLGDYMVGKAGSQVRESFRSYSEPDEERIAAVAAQALDELQDYIDEATHDPWPGESKPPGAYAQVRDRVLYLWYGGSDMPGDAVLSCEPISLTDLQRSP